jgi:hypothetical protein
LVSAGDPIHSTGQVLNGAKLLWQAFVAAGLPLRRETNEILRSQHVSGVALVDGLHPRR